MCGEEILSQPSFRRLVYSRRLRPSHHLLSPFTPQLVDETYIKENVDIFRAKLRPFVTRDSRIISTAVGSVKYTAGNCCFQTYLDFDAITERVLLFLTGELSENAVVAELERAHRLCRADHFIFVVQNFIQTGFSSTIAYDLSCYYRYIRDHSQRD